MLTPGRYFLAGNVATAEAALLAGCRFYAGYPITPSSELMEHMAKRMVEENGVFIQMEDELSAISAIIGAAWTGKKAMTATSGPGFSLMQENIGYAAMTETPIVIVDVMRGGPSTGQPTIVAQGDVLQSRFGSHGDYETIVLSPNSVQELFDLTIRAFNLAAMFRNPVIVLSDAELAHMVEKVEVPKSVELIDFNQIEIDMVPSFVPLGYGFRVAVTGLTHNFKGYPITNDVKVHRELVTRLVNKIIKNEPLISDVEIINPDADTIIVSYGIASRAAYPVIRRHKNLGLFRPRTLWPFPESKFKDIVKGKRIITLEMNLRGYAMEVERLGRKYGAVDFKTINIIGGEVPKPSHIEEVL
ncbi:MAG: 2-oxoacid:acceptor oxidoreductase subunit alpha [Thermoplasmata archaeon]|jgi:2-oxoglutarate ferredoxin oxidoreductase subunit alpha|nr:2-oxoacid:acceptor oxidoreductase subunit alpha [Thermoplasmatales archaeon]